MQAHYDLFATSHQVEFYLQHYSTFILVSSDIPSKNIQIETYADDITFTAFHT